MKTETDVLAATSAAPADALPDFNKWNAEERNHYMTTGETPSERTPKPESDAAAVPDGEKPADESGATSEAAKHDTTPQDPPRETRADRRYRQLANENKRLAAEIEQLRTSKPAEPVKPPEAKPAEPKIPKLKDYETSEEWEDAKDAWYAKNTQDAVREALRSERESHKQEEQQTEQQKRQDQGVKDFTKRATEFRKTLAKDTFAEDFVSVKDFLAETKADDLAQAIFESEVGPNLMTYFNSTDETWDEFEKLAAMNPNAALRELGRLEVSEKIKGPAPKTRTAAKKIGSEVGGKTSVSDEDEAINEAVRTGNQKEYNRLMAKREAAENRR